MRRIRSLLLLSSALVVVALIGGGLAARVGSAESPYRQAVLFAEILSQVMDNYVDPVDRDKLLVGAYEGMLAGLDPNGAYLDPAEVASWKSAPEGDQVDAGFSVLKSGRMLQVVAVEPESAAASAGIRVGDQVRAVDGVEVRDLSLEQSRRLLRGPIESSVRVELLHPSDSFRREEIEIVRSRRQAKPFELRVEDDLAILRVDDLRDLPVESLARELADLRSGDVDRLLIDVRFLAEGGPRDAVRLSAALIGKTRLELRDRSGRLVESVASPDDPFDAWSGPLFVLVNGATAGGAEALALLLRDDGGARIYGESTYGLGAETTLFELDGGGGLLVSAATWESADGARWNGDGIEPDQVVEGEGADPAESSADQLRRVLEALSADAGTAECEGREAA